MRSLEGLAARLEALYAEFNRPLLIGDDPLGCVRPYANPADREVAALVAAVCAFGNVKQISASIRLALAVFGQQPAQALRDISEAELVQALGGWRHRWANGRHLANLLIAARSASERYGSLGAAWIRARRAEDADAHDTLQRWVLMLCECGLRRDNPLVPQPDRGSACKRLHLLLRWLVRCDAVDPGGWPDDPSRLLVPLDVHMLRIARALRFTRRKAADLKAAREVTRRFRLIRPDDPVRYDFALTRLPIHQRWSLPEIRRYLLDVVHR
ncbi:MAG: TIGR02757 family protein [Kiritimatiellae bacterium]|nr:TIGR02757 family protein [Kiritimatiellia bacterium]MDW8458617.1 TIGR02757 family protein [Verrucomicrobiota bacterium]